MTRQLHFLLYPGFQLLDLAGPVSAFEHANEVQPGAYAWHLWGLEAGRVASSSGLAFDVAALDELAPGPDDTLLVVGGNGVLAAIEQPRFVAGVQAAAAASGRVASICSGAFALAAAGLLAGRRATTHWRRSQDFARRFPGVRLEADRIYVQDGRFWTAAGISAGIDLALALIAADRGEACARQVARHLVVYFRRPGGQSQHSALLEMAAGGSRFAGLLDHVRGHLADDLGVEALAALACMSPRHFSRRFTDETGLTPARAVEQLRVEAAQGLLEAGGLSVQEVARRCGFGDGERLRRSFQRLLGIAPSAVKARRE